MDQHRFHTLMTSQTAKNAVRPEKNDASVDHPDSRLICHHDGAKNSLARSKQDDRKHVCKICQEPRV